MNNVDFIKRDYSKGFSLIEILVAISVFIFIVISISQIFISIIQAEKLGYTLLNAENNIRNNLEIMARAIRMGTEFDDNSSNLSQLCFKNSNKQSQCFLIEEDENDNLTLKQEIDGVKQVLLDPSLKIISGRFYQIGGNQVSQKLIIIQLEVLTELKKQSYVFHVETAVARRFLTRNLIISNP